MKKKHALIYIRVSTEKQAEKGVSLDSQREQCFAYATEAGYSVGKKDVFVDAGESARSMARPALSELLERAKEDKEVCAVVVYDISRLARNRLDFALIKQVFKKEGVTLLSVTEAIDDTPEGQMLEGMLSTVAEFFSAQNGRKVAVNMAKKARDGGWPAHAPYGYRNRKEKLDSGEVKAWIEPHPDEAEWVKRAFKLFSTGEWSVKRLTTHLEEEGIPLRSYKNRRTRRFHNSALDRMLRNRLYMGLIDWGKEVVGVKGNHEPLVSPSLFYRVQDLLEEREGSVSRGVRHYSPLKLISLCATCGSTMTLDLTPTTARTIRYFRCRKMKAGKTVKCDERYFEEDAYLEEAGKFLAQVELTPEDIEESLERIEEELTRQSAGVAEKVKEMRGRLEEVRLRKKKLLLRELDGDLDAEVYREVKTDLDREEAELRERLAKSEVELDRKKANVLAMAADILGVGGRAFGAVDNSEVKGLLLRTIFQELKLSGGRIRQATLHPLFEYFEKSIRNVQIPLAFHVDTLLFGAQGGKPVEAGTSCQNGPDCTHGWISEELEKDIEQCYAELERRGFFLGGAPTVYRVLG